MIDLVDRQALHQWRFMNDEVYRLEYDELLNEMDIAMEMLQELKLLFIPIKEMDNVLFDGTGARVGN